MPQILPFWLYRSSEVHACDIVRFRSCGLNVNICDYKAAQNRFLGEVRLELPQHLIDSLSVFCGAGSRVFSFASKCSSPL